MLKEVGGSFVQIFFPLFTPIWRDCILKGEERKLVGSTTFLSPSPSQPNSEKCHFSPYFSLPIFHPPCFHSNQTYPKETHAKKTDDLLNEINKKLDLMKLE